MTGRASAGKPFPERSAIELSPEKLAEYAGVYRINADETHALVVEDGRTYTEVELLAAESRLPGKPGPTTPGR